jgi:hypothetical protein
MLVLAVIYAGVAFVQVVAPNVRRLPPA